MSGLSAHGQLTPVLRQLKLTGMLDTLDARLVQSPSRHLSPPSHFPQVPLPRTNWPDATLPHYSRRLRAAHLPTAATLETFDYNFNPKAPVAQIRDLARLEFIDAGESAVADGPVGVGKTHVAVGLADQAARRGRRGDPPHLQPAVGRAGWWTC